MSDDKEPKMVDNAKEAEMAAEAPPPADKATDSWGKPTAGANEVTPSDALKSQEKKKD